MGNNNFHIEYKVYSMARGLTNGLKCKTIFILPMDPKTQLSGLDPKLKEAYERVMGTTIPPAPPPVSPPPAPPQEPAASMPTVQTEPSSPPPLPSNEPPKEPVSPPIQEPVQEPTPPPPAAPPQPPEPAAPPLQEPELPPTPPVQPPVAQNEPTGFVANAAKKGKLGGSKISPSILMAVGVALLVLYVFFWIRVFNLSLF